MAQAQLDEALGNAGISNLSGLTGLTELCLAGRSAITARGLSFLQAFTSLRHLNLSRVCLDGSSSGGSAAFLWHLTQLTALLIAGSLLPAAEFAAGLPLLQNLAELDVSGTGLSDDNCGLLTAMPGLHSIK